MRFSLRTLAITCTVVVILVGWGVREFRLRIPTHFPVTYSTKPVIDTRAPEEFLAWRKPSLWEATRAAEEATDLMLRKYNPTDEDVLQKLLNDPADIYYITDQVRKVITANRERVLEKAPQWLSDKTDHNTLIGAAHVLAVLNDRRAFELAIKRLPQIAEDPRELDLMRRLACTHPTDWAIASPEIMAAARDAHYKAPDHQLARVLEKSGDKAAAIHYHRLEANGKKSIYHRTSALQWLTENAASEEVFQQVKKLFKSPKILTDHDAPKLLELYLQSDNSRWRTEAFEIAMQMTKTPPGQRGGYHVYPYEHLIFAHGGEEYLDYFKSHVKNQKCGFAMQGLARLLPREEYLALLRQNSFLTLYLEEAGDAAIPFLRKKNALFMLAEHQAGTKDPVTAAAIRNAITPETNFFTGLQLIDALETLGVEVDRDQLMDGLTVPQYNPQDPDNTRLHWLVNRITNDDFLQFMNQYAASFRSTTKTPLTAQQAFDDLDIPEDHRRIDRFCACQLMAATGVAKCIEIDLYGYDLTGVMAKEFADLFAEDLPFESVGFEAPHLRFAGEHFVFEVPLIETGSWCPPTPIVDVLNSILDKHSESPRRLYCFDMGADYWHVTIAYLDPTFVKTLEQTYAVYPLPTKRIRQ